MQKSKEIYLDNAAATAIDASVLSAMQKVFRENFANPGSIHEMGIKTMKILEQNRAEVGEILGAHSDEIIFTSGATESNNLAIMGIVRNFLEGGKRSDLKNSKRSDLEEPTIPHIITTNIEHPSVLETCKHLEETKQAEVTYVPVEANGIVDPKKIRQAIKLNTILVSVMYANNEIGTIQPVMEIAKEIRHYRKTHLEKVRPPLVFHSDATQAVNYLPIKVEKLGVDLMSFNSGKIYGPKGVGVLYIKRKTPISKIMFGGNQEFGFRPGTENVAMVTGLTEALKMTEKIKEKEVKRLTKLRDHFIEKLIELGNQGNTFPKGQGFPLVSLSFNGDLKNRLPNNVNITILKIPSDLLVLEFSARGIYISEKSACKSGEKAGSYVIQALHQMPDKACKKPDGSLRFSLGRQTTKADIDYVLKSLCEILEKLKRWYN